MNDAGSQIFRDRTEAGRLLASELGRFVNRPNVLILALPRGGVPVAFEIALALHAPLDVFLVRKLGVPGQEELAMGAIASGNVRILQSDVVSALGISPSGIDTVTTEEMRELARRERAICGDRPHPQIRNREVILVDDGLATGSTMYAAVVSLKQQHPQSISVAVPVAAREACEEFRSAVDEIICLRTPESFLAVGLCYEMFPQLTDEEVRELLKKADEFQAFRSYGQSVRVS